MLYPQHRHRNARRLTAHIMHTIDMYLPYDDKNRVRRDISNELEKLFYTTGVDIITEADRIQAGLMPRDHNGLTLEEIKLIDARYMKALLEPLTTPIINEEKS
jgi:hypothetical protein